MDSYLEELVRAAEDGTPCPPVWLTLGSGDIVNGIARPSADFIERTHESMVQHYVKHAPVSWSRSARKPNAEAQASAELAQFENVRPSPSEVGRVVTLAPATVIRSGGDTVELQVLRLDLHHVVMWWLAPGKLKGDPMTFAGVGITF